MNAIDPRIQLANRIGEFRFDPLSHALFSYPWETERLKAPGPRTWQRETFQQIKEHLESPNTRHQPCRISVASGHGIGKSAEIAMVNKWALDTCPNTRVMVTANTEGQLHTKTSPELIKWHNLALTHDWFRTSTTSMVSRQPGHEKIWRCDLVTWSENNTEAFAGLHNEGSRIVLIYDEASGIPDKVWEVSLGALTDANTEIIWLAFGNPTQNTGAFRETFGKHRNLWKTKQIDSRTVEGTNKAYLDEIAKTYGEDSDITKVRVRGMFPSASSMQFIALDVVEAAQARQPAPGLASDPLIYGLDCARFGDDSSVLAKRCGRDAKSRPWKRWQKADAMLIAGDVALEAQREHPDAIFVDAGNIGAAIVDRLRQLLPDTPIYEVWFGGTGRDAEFEPGLHIRTKNKRTEIWTTMRAWLRGGAIPDYEPLRDDLIGPLYGFDADQALILERKADMKKRGLSSPDDADALATTFAEPVAPRAVPGYLNPQNTNPGGGDRYAEI
jgi:hypothetical protein